MTAENLDGEQDVSTTRHRNERKGSEPCGAFTLLALPSEGKREQKRHGDRSQALQGQGDVDERKVNLDMRLLQEVHLGMPLLQGVCRRVRNPPGGNGIAPLAHGGMQ
jgi:hypothetical protein